MKLPFLSFHFLCLSAFLSNWIYVCFGSHVHHVHENGFNLANHWDTNISPQLILAMKHVPLDEISIKSKTKHHKNSESENTKASLNGSDVNHMALENIVNCHNNNHVDGEWIKNLRGHKSFYCCRSGRETDNLNEFCDQDDNPIVYFTHGSHKLSSTTGRGCECDAAGNRFRHDLLSKRELYEWKPLKCQLHTWSSIKFCNLLRNRKVLMVGDSTMEQTATTLMSMITVGGGGCATDVTYARSDFLYLPRFGLEFPFDEVVSREFPDIVILTAGAWLEDEGDMQTVLTYVTEHLTPKFPGDMSADEQAKRTPKYIWKTQNPGHVGCQNFSAPISTAQEAELKLTTQQSPYHWHLFPTFDRMARNFLVNFGFRFIDMSPLYLRPDSHPGGLPVDCLHICMPGPIDLFSTLFLQMLHNAEV